VLHHDYNNDITHLGSKEMRNLINRWSIDRRYPLLDTLIRNYNNDSKSLRPAPSDNNSNAVKSAVRRSRKEFADHLDRVAQSNLKRRWVKPDAVNKGDKFKFAVVLPCYNLGSLVEDAVKSVMRQTLDSVQIIVVDDKSNDEDTKAVLKSLESHVEVIYHKVNGGASAARNTGVAAANADYILCLDS